ncbi:MAG: hypothetical protein Q9160_003453 [Pyrenula sp. 1 TL-2023]
MAESTIAAPQSYTQPSRKGKKAWRKNIDITPVTAGLSDLRDEIIAHGGPVSEKPSDELFTLDTIGDDAVRKRVEKAHKPLKADEILAQRSAVPAIDTRKRKFGGDGIVEIKRRKGDWVSKKEVQRLKQVAADGDRNLLAKVEGDGEAPTTDLWDFTSLESTHLNAPDPQASYIPRPRPKVAPSTLSHPPVALTASGRSTPSIPNPNPGTSYNPSFTDWDDLLTAAGEAELQAERKRLAEQAAETERAERIAAAATSQAKADRSDAEESAWEGVESDKDTDADTLKKRPGRKTPAQRNKAKRRKEAERLAKHEKKMKTKAGDRNRNHNRKTQGEELLQWAKEFRAQKRHASSTATTATPTSNPNPSSSPSSSEPLTRNFHAKLGGTVPRPSKSTSITNPSSTSTLTNPSSTSTLTNPLQTPLELVLPDELQESLRRLKPEGNLLSDRMRHVLVNGKVEPRRRVGQVKKPRRTWTEKWRFKDFKVDVK